MSGARLPRTMIGDLSAAVGGRVRVCGWVESLGGDDDRRDAQLRDVSGAVALERQRSGEADLVADSLAAMGPGSAVEVVGRVVEDAVGLHVDVDDLSVAGPALC